ncbi:MAG: hypothetical protein ACO2O2_14980 [Acidilobaceae archaeon]
MAEAKIVLPPLKLASEIMKTVVTASCVNCEELRFRLDTTRGLEVIEVEIPRGDSLDIILHDMLSALESYRKHADELGDVPILRQRMTGSDYDIFEEGLSVKLPGRREKWGEFYTSLLRYVREHLDEVKAGISPDGVTLGVERGNLKLSFGGDLRLPRLLVSEGFYELGKFGGLKDVKSTGRPSLGIVEIRANGGVVALLTASLLALTAGSGSVGETDVYVIPTMSIVGVKVERFDAEFLTNVFSQFNLIIRSKSQYWMPVEDVDGMRLAALFEIYSRVGERAEKLIGSRRVLESIRLNLSTFSSTGLRFYRREGFTISLGEVANLGFAMEAVGFTGRDKYKVASTVARLIISTLYLSKIASEQGLYKRLASDAKMFAYSIATGVRRPYLDALYRLSRCLREEDVLWRIAQESSELIDEEHVESYIEDDYKGERDRRKALLKSEAQRTLRLLHQLAKRG